MSNHGRRVGGTDPRVKTENVGAVVRKSRSEPVRTVPRAGARPGGCSSPSRRRGARGDGSCPRSAAGGDFGSRRHRLGSRSGGPSDPRGSFSGVDATAGGVDGTGRSTARGPAATGSGARWRCRRRGRRPRWRRWWRCPGGQPATPATARTASSSAMLRAGGPPCVPKFAGRQRRRHLPGRHRQRDQDRLLRVGAQRAGRRHPRHRRASPSTKRSTWTPSTQFVKFINEHYELYGRKIVSQAHRRRLPHDAARLRQVQRRRPAGREGASPSSSSGPRRSTPRSTTSGPGPASSSFGGQHFDVRLLQPAPAVPLRPLHGRHQGGRPHRRVLLQEDGRRRPPTTPARSSTRPIGGRDTHAPPRRSSSPRSRPTCSPPSASQSKVDGVQRRRRRRARTYKSDIETRHAADPGDRVGAHRREGHHGRLHVRPDRAGVPHQGHDRQRLLPRVPAAGPRPPRLRPARPALRPGADGPRLRPEPPGGAHQPRRHRPGPGLAGHRPAGPPLRRTTAAASRGRTSTSSAPRSRWPGPHLNPLTLERGLLAGPARPYGGSPETSYLVPSDAGDYTGHRGRQGGVLGPDRPVGGRRQGRGVRPAERRQALPARPVAGRPRAASRSGVDDRRRRGAARRSPDRVPAAAGW